MCLNDLSPISVPIWAQNNTGMTVHHGQRPRQKVQESDSIAHPAVVVMDKMGQFWKIYRQGVKGYRNK
jgi:hypothetical protein